MKRVIAKIVFVKDGKEKPMGIRIISDDSTRNCSYTQDIDDDTVNFWNEKGEINGYEDINSVGKINYATDEAIVNKLVVLCKTLDEACENDFYICVDAEGNYSTLGTEQIINNIRSNAIANAKIDGLEIVFSNGKEIEYCKEIKSENKSRKSLDKLALVNKMMNTESKFEVDGDVLVKYKGKGDDTVNIPNGIKKIGKSAFERNKEIKRVIFSDTVEIIDERAFCECTALSEVVLNKKLSIIAKWAFKGCYSIREITLPKKLGGSNLGFEALNTGDRIIKVHIGRVEVNRNSFGQSPRIIRDSNL